MILRYIRNSERGAAAVEFALAVPVLILVIWGIFQVGLLFEANSGMQHALGEGARLATIYDSSTSNHIPTDASIKAQMNAKLFGPNDGTFTISNPVDGTGYKDLNITYTRTMDFLFFTGPTVTLTRSKRVYTVS